MNQATKNQQRYCQLKWLKHAWFPKTQDQGFTLTEVLVVIVIAGVLAAIAAPGWLAFMNRQRVQTARTETLQIVREAQKEAITKRTQHGIRIVNGVNQGDEDKIEKRRRKDGQTTTLRDQVLSSDDFDVEITTVPNVNELFFDFDGSVRPTGLAANADGSIYKVVLQTQTNGQATGSKYCVIVETLLGSMRESSDDECD